MESFDALNLDRLSARRPVTHRVCGLDLFEMRGNNMNRKAVIAIDFDGVIHRYSEGWKDGTVYDEPMEGVERALPFLEQKGCNLIIFTARPIEPVIEWLKEKLSITHIKVTNTKPVADVYIDDRGIRFLNWDQAINDLMDLNLLRI